MNCAGKTETDDWYKDSDAKLVSPPFNQIFGGLWICFKDLSSLKEIIESGKSNVFGFLTLNIRRLLRFL